MNIWNVPLERNVEIAIIDSKEVHVGACQCRLTHHAGSQPKVKSGSPGYARRIGEICRLGKSRPKKQSC
jgi:hypothetical protein